jgi:uncharacterized SAM-binding protein YcdF (DUF218 family)
MLFGPVRLISKLLSLVVFAAVVYVIVCGVQVVNASRLSTTPDSVRPAAAIVVLGEPVAKADRTDLTARLRQAALLYRSNRAPKVLLTWYPPSAGEVGSLSYDARWLEAHGVVSSELVAREAPNAVVALSKAAKLFDRRGSGVIVVTDAIDALWTQGAGSADGLTLQVSPPPSSKKFVFDELGPLLRESTGVAVGRVFGFGRAAWAAY